MEGQTYDAEGADFDNLVKFVQKGCQDMKDGKVSFDPSEKQFCSKCNKLHILVEHQSNDFGCRDVNYVKYVNAGGKGSLSEKFAICKVCFCKFCDEADLLNHNKTLNCKPNVIYLYKWGLIEANYTEQTVRDSVHAYLNIGYKFGDKQKCKKCGVLSKSLYKHQKANPLCFLDKRKKMGPSGVAREPKYKCNLCEKSYIRKDSLVRHKKKKHITFDNILTNTTETDTVSTSTEERNSQQINSLEEERDNSNALQILKPVAVSTTSEIETHPGSSRLPSPSKVLHKKRKHSSSDSESESDIDKSAKRFKSSNNEDVIKKRKPEFRRTFPCFCCKKMFRLDILRRHVNLTRCWAAPFKDGAWKPRGGDEQCPRCRQWCDGNDELCKKLIPNLKLEDRFKCPFCKIRSKRAETMKRHIISNFDKEAIHFDEIKCYNCLQTFDHDVYLDHLNKDKCVTHDDILEEVEFDYPCQYCGDFYKLMDKHEPICPKRPKPLAKTPMQYNKEDHNPKSKRQKNPHQLPESEKEQSDDVECKFCDKKFTNLKFLKQHVRINHFLERNRARNLLESTFECKEEPVDEPSQAEEANDVIPNPPRTSSVKTPSKNKTRASTSLKNKVNPGLHLSQQKHNQCIECGSIFNKLTSLTYHVKNKCQRSKKNNLVLKERRVPCLYCLRSLPNSKKLQEHIATTDCRFRGQFAKGHCPYCDQLIGGDEISTETHMKECKMREHVSQYKEFRCDECGWKFGDFSSLLADYNSKCRKKLRKPGFTCGVCAYIAPTTDLIVKHCSIVHDRHYKDQKIINTNEGKFYCFICGEIFFNEYTCRQETENCMIDVDNYTGQYDLNDFIDVD